MKRILGLMVFGLCIIVCNCRAETMDDLNARFAKLYSEGKYNEALPVLEDALKAGKEIYAKEASPLVVATQDMAELYNIVQNGAGGADTYYKQAIAIYKKKLGPEDQSVIISYEALGKYYAQQYMMPNAEECYKQALEIYKKAPSANKIRMAETLSNLGDVYFLGHRFPDAIAIYKKLCILLEELYGKDTVELLNVLDRLYEMYFFDKNYEDAEKVAKRTLEIGRHNYPGVSKFVIETEVKLGDLAFVQNRPAEAVSYYRRAVGMTKQVYGKTSPYLKTLALRLSSVKKAAMEHR